MGELLHTVNKQHRLVAPKLCEQLAVQMVEIQSPLCCHVIA
jgi:hypothetical protein